MKPKTIGERIREYREARGMSTFDLAVEARIQEQNIRNWETGRKVPSTDFIPALAKALGVTPNDLFGVDAPDAADEDASDAEPLPAAVGQEG